MEAPACRKAPPERRSPQLVSVIVPARDAADTLPHQLAALAAQDYPGRWETLVVDNGSRDATAAVARAWTAGRDGRRVALASDRRGPSHARNFGVGLTQGELLAFCDADDEVAPGWLGALVAAAQGCDVLAGRLEGEVLNDPVTRSWHRRLPADRPLDSGCQPFASSCNLAVWRDTFEALEGFDEDLSAGEDQDFSWRARLAGQRLGYSADAVVHRRFRSRLRALARQQFAYGQGQVALFIRHREHGLGRSAPSDALRAWLGLALAFPGALGCRSRRGRWVAKAALRAGRLTASARRATACL